MNRPAPQSTQDLYITPEDAQTAIGWCIRSMAANAKEMTSLVSHLCNQVDAKKVRRDAQTSPVDEAEILSYLAHDTRIDATMPDPICDIILAARENKIILKKRMRGTQAGNGSHTISDEMMAGDNLCQQVREERYRRQTTPKISILF